ncbi:MAG: DUF1990 family protein [Pyrinomonadaceae bacterium]
MFFFKKPHRTAVDKFLMECEKASFSYTEIGATKSKIPASYNVDHNRVHIGNGDADFEKAKTVVRGFGGLSFLDLVQIL